MIEIIATAAIAAPLGFLTCAFLTAGKVADAASNEQMLEVMTRRGVSVALDLVEAEDAHTRVSDSRNVLLARIERLKDIASKQPSVKSGRIIAVLEGEA